ncbi:MAG: type VI secretion system tip protein VgrG [Spirulina sp.]
MPDPRTLPIPAEHREFTVKVNGEVLGREHQLIGVYVTKTANKIASARLIYLDGAAATGNFPLSNTDRFVPGQAVEILAGTGQDSISLFQGIVIRQNLKIRDRTAPQLIVECRHPAVKLTIARKNAYFFEQRDSDIISGLLEEAGIEAEVESTATVYPQQVQYCATDWDFLLLRAEANGKLVLTNDEGVTVKAPAFDRPPICTLQFGATILEMDAAIDARGQYDAVKSLTWDSAAQTRLEKEATDPGVQGLGNLENAELAAVAGLESYPQHHVAIAAEEAQAWADAQWLKSQMSRVSGVVKCEGIATVNPGDIVRLSGVGDRYNGNAFVTGVRQDFDLVQGWKTHVQFGNVDRWLGQENDVSAPLAAALVPGVNGLQIGVVVSNEDPEGEHRVRVRMPLVDEDEEGTWARVATLDAGSDRGFFFRPEIEDEVILGFLNDDPRQAVILGMLHSSAKAAPLEGSDDNPEKMYQSRSQMKLYFNDEKKILRLETPAGNKLTLSEEEAAIAIEDQNDNKITLTPDGIQIESSRSLHLKAGTELSIEGSSVQIG